ncbi:uncharacterized protein LOC128092331 [Culex pipiens pallens]|uniref:uncharacterized protein LOC128092331 n=1 Tax=Culex pipiens pallens TaxID=42434 RepID=UPI0022AA53D5|nr:uncharacterized protein LOC128092331 [Culex pipiens pallens]
MPHFKILNLIPRTSPWPPRKAEPAGRGEEEDGPNIRDVGRVQEQLENPSETDDHLGLLLNLPEEARRRTVRTSGTLAPSSRKAGESIGDGRPPRAAVEPAGRGEEEDGPNFRDVGRVQEQLENPSETDDHLGLLLNLPGEARRRRTVNTVGTVAKFKILF